MNKQTMWMAGLGIAATSALATAMILAPREQKAEAEQAAAAPAKAQLVAQSKPAQVKKTNWPFGSTARTQTLTVPEGTELPVRLTHSLSTEKNATGETFNATLDAPLMVNGQQIAAAGSNVEGTLTEVVDSGRVKGLARMSMRLTRIERNGKWMDIATATRSFQAENSKKRDAGVIAGSAAIGAAIGAISGGGKGAAIGAGVGGGAGTGAVLATKGKPVEFGPEARIRFTLNAPWSVTL